MSRETSTAGPSLARMLGRRLIPRRIRDRLRPLSTWPPVGRVEFGDLRRTAPISRTFGFDRGVPIDRYYIEDFIGRYSSGPSPTIHGRVLEIGTPLYTERFGNAVERSDVLDISPDNPRATLIADLTDAPSIPSDTFDCVVCTQTLLLIYDVKSAVRTIHRILKPGGSALVTLPGVSQSPQPDRSVFGDYWRFTSLSARRLLEEFFLPEDVEVEGYGNVLVASAFLYGLAVEDVSEAEIDVHDPDYEILIGVKAIKRSAPSQSPSRAEAG